MCPGRAHCLVASLSLAAHLQQLGVGKGTVAEDTWPLWMVVEEKQATGDTPVNDLFCAESPFCLTWDLELCPELVKQLQDKPGVGSTPWEMQRAGCFSSSDQNLPYMPVKFFLNHTGVQV